jgi:predicted ATPase
MIITATTSALVKGLSISGRPADALELIDRLIPEVEERGELFYMPDLLRIKGDLQASLPDRAIVAEQTLLQSLDWARKQQALSWELRSATRLVELYRDRGQSRKADSLLRPVYERFTEGFETADLVRARGLLDGLR